jgi:PAT family beta-lactamase induction signal transducer AmpG
MGLCMMVTGAISGHLQQMMGYVSYFVFVMVATIPSFLATWFVPFHQREDEVAGDAGRILEDPAHETSTHKAA